MGDYLMSISHGANISWVEDQAPKPSRLMSSSWWPLPECCVWLCTVEYTRKFIVAVWYGFIIFRSYNFRFPSLDYEFERRLIGATLSDFYCLFFEAMSFCLLAICPLKVTGCVTSFGVVDNYLPFLCFKIYIVNLLCFGFHRYFLFLDLLRLLFGFLSV